MTEETHFKTDRIPPLRHRQYHYSYHAPNPNAKSKGVCILGTVLVELVTFYCPHTDQDKFMSGLLSDLTQFMEGFLEIGGDLNMPFAPPVDSSAGSSVL